MATIADLTYTSLETITAFELNTGNYIFTLDELQDATIDNTEETEEITGKNGRKLALLKRNKAVTVSGNNGMVSGGLLEVQTGGTLNVDATTEVMWADYLTVSSDAATTTYTAVGTTGSEIVSLYTKNSDGTLATELTQSDTAGDGVFAYDPSTKALTFSGIEDNTEIYVLYKRKIVADTLENPSDTYSKTVQIYLDALAEDKCGNIFHVQFYFPKASFTGEFSIEFGDNQTVHSFEFESLVSACGGANGALWYVTIFGESTADAE